jgi:phytoene/squalene synthetase
MKALFDEISIRSSRMVTKKYSTSFSLGILFLNKDFRDPIYSIYGFVRFADEIVDTFHDYNKNDLLDKFKADTHQAIKEGISLNPILNSFQETVRTYEIDIELIDTFLKSMEMDLHKKQYSKDKYEEYILGSAEVVGLMCLKVFVNNDKALYNELKPHAMKLGSAFQKINFLRDLHEDYCEMGRVYFPGVEMKEFNEECKREIEEDIKRDFQAGFEGVKKLPKSSSFGVYVAYVYFYSLLKKIQNTPTNTILNSRVRIQNSKKIILLLKSYLQHSFNLL